MVLRLISLLNKPNIYKGYKFVNLCNIYTKFIEFNFLLLRRVWNTRHLGIGGRGSAKMANREIIFNARKHTKTTIIHDFVFFFD